MLECFLDIEKKQDGTVLFDSLKIISSRVPADELKPDQSEFKMQSVALEQSLEQLSKMLCKHYGVPAVILIDEYDMPLNQAFEEGYYNAFVKTYRSILSSALKGNKYLAFAVLTGCLRISKESIFTGLNNLKVYDVTSFGMAERFGFSDEEVSEMLEYYGLGDYQEEVRKFYDGYLFKSNRVYNPRSVNNFVSDAVASRSCGSPVSFQCEWLNTSHNDILVRLLDMALKKGMVSAELKQLGEGKCISRTISSNLTFDDMHVEPDALWTVMLYAGYLTCDKRLGDSSFRLRVPNEEVQRAYDKLMILLTLKKIEKGKYQESFCKAIETFDPARIEEELNSILMKGTRLRDTATKSVRENYYHGVLNVVLMFRTDWDTVSNAESALWYCDIMIEDADKGWGIILELKYSESATSFEAALNEGANSIKTCDYISALQDQDYASKNLYAIAFHGKKCKVHEVFVE